MILAPYGINGMLIGPVNREIDLTAIRDNWEKNYPIRHFDGLPDFVEVIIGKVDVNPQRDYSCLILRQCANVLSYLLCI